MAQTTRWGIAATGAIATSFAEGLAQLDGADTVAVASRTAARAEAFGDRFGIARRHASYEELAADPAVDVVYVATPHARHADDAVLFLEAGKHVLCEKPLALSEAQARRMVDVARTSGRFLMEAIWSRFLPAYRELARVLVDGAIGTPLHVDADFGYRRPVEAGNRHFDLALGGGALLDLGIYPLQLASFVLGRPDGIAAVGHLGDTGVDEQVTAVLHHPTGALASVRAAMRVAMACTARISGTDGWIDLPAFMHCPAQVTVTTSAGRAVIDAPIVGQGLRYEAIEVHRCLAEGLLESPTMSLDESCTLAATMDSVRAQIGLRYPGE
jgi:predicted dehydrogenase